VFAAELIEEGGGCLVFVVVDEQEVQLESPSRQLAE
jgi:hypothetical protein